MIPNWILLVVPFIGVALVAAALWVANRIDPVAIRKRPSKPVGKATEQRFYGGSMDIAYGVDVPKSGQFITHGKRSNRDI